MKNTLFCAIVSAISLCVVGVEAQEMISEEPTKLVNLRTFDADKLAVALRNGDLVRGGVNENAEVVSTQILAVVRTSQGSEKNYIELSDRDCKTWSKFPLENVLSATETLVPSVSCGGEKYPYMRLVLRNGEQYTGNDKDDPAVITISFTKSTIRKPQLVFGGSLGVSDTIIDHCTDVYLGCQLDECAGSGQWCLDMCEAEFDFCVADR